MSNSLEELYQSIGEMALAHSDALKGKLLLYVEIETGVISADIFYLNTQGVLRYKFCRDELQDTLYSFWSEWRATLGNHEWRAMVYILDGGHISVDLIYPDQIDEREDVSDRRPAVIAN